MITSFMYILINYIQLFFMYFHIQHITSTCKVEASEGEEVLDVVMSQFHHDQADQSPATHHTDTHAGRLKAEAQAPHYSWGTRRIWELMVHLLWQKRLASLLFRQISI